MISEIQIETVARLRELIATIERDLGLESLSAKELDVLYVVRLLCDRAGSAAVEVAEIRRHPITRSMSQPTFNRALRALLDQGYVAPAPAYKAKRYVLGPEIAKTERRTCC